MHSKVSSDWLPRYTKVTRTVLDIFKMAGYFPDRPRTLCTTFSNPTFSPHNVFMWFVWIWKQTAIIFLYRINLLGLIVQTFLFTAQYELNLGI